MAYRLPVSRDAERQWRSTFTRENRLGEAKLMHELRHKGSMQVALDQKAAFQAREKAAGRAKGERMAAAALDGMRLGDIVSLPPPDIRTQEERFEAIERAKRRAGKRVYGWDSQGRMILKSVNGKAPSHDELQQDLQDRA